MPKAKTSSSKPKPKPKEAPVAAKTEIDPLADALPPEKPPNYTIGKWNKLDMFQCTRCPWSTLDEDEMVRHVAKHFSSAAPSVKRTDTGFVTVTGDKIIREEIVEPFEEDKEV